VKPKLKFEHRFPITVLAWTLPVTALAVAVVCLEPLSQGLKWSAVLVIGGLWVTAALVLRRKVVRPLQTISNLLAALRQEDFSTRASGAQANDALGEVYLEINTLSTLLQEQRLGALEATALLRAVMEEIDVAVLTFDHDQKLRLVNRSGERLLAQPAERLLGRTAADLNLLHCLEGEPTLVLQAAFPGGMGRWSIRRGTFWQGGLRRHLVVVADVSRALREEERLAWQRLVRVLGHEINNSLAPIKSIAGSLSHLLAKEPAPSDWREDMGKGLGVIASRAEALGRFMGAYTQLAKLPPVRPRLFDLGPWLQRMVRLETRLPVALNDGPAVNLNADSDQLEQVLINLLKNAVDAVLQGDGQPGKNAAASEPPVQVTWGKSGRHVEIRVEDCGPGPGNTGNLFVPFFTTKPSGSGIGLVLSRQIAEAHGGTLTLEARKDRPGCAAVLRLPLG
jgi:nitrogen fixation/metabolism regulation signal transduction histidine kinase